MAGNKKKKILWHSDASFLLTGFGRNSKAVLKYLYDTGKYQIVEYACAPFTFNDKRLERLPWKAYGAIPEDEFVRNEIQNNPYLESTVRYGSFYIDEIVLKEKPDCYIGVNDFWAFKEYYDKPWWNKINSALWVTLDSLPIYDDAVQNAHKVKNFWVWAGFAEKEMKRLGFPQVETLHGAFDVSDFYPLKNKYELKSRFGIQDNFIFGFVFRNQGRKLIGTLLEGFSIFKKHNPNDTSKLLLHTSWSEGWNIDSFINEFGVKKSDVLTTHVCRSCKKYDIKPHDGEGVDCNFCGSKKSVITPNGGCGLSESEMNEIYNLIDFYIHPITSGGLEMPLVESLLAGTPISTVNYSCGEEFCSQPFVTKIDYSTYREFGSQFIKSQPYAEDIAIVMAESSMCDPDTLSSLASSGREWALREFDLNTICKRIEDWIDNCPEVKHDYVLSKTEMNDKYELNTSEITDEEWTIDLIENVFGYCESSKNDTVIKIVKQLKDGESKQSIYNKAIEAAKIHNESKRKTAADNFFKKEDETDNVCVIAPDTLEQKIIMSKFFQELCEKEKNVFLVGDEKIDSNIFGQFGKFTLMPKQGDKQMEWLSNLRNSSGAKRFKRIYYQFNTTIQYVENQ